MIMTRTDIAKEINWNGTATRMIHTNNIPSYFAGEIVNPGLCWTDGGEFKIETTGKYTVIFVIENNVDGHAVDYDNETECEAIGAIDCENEKEILINRSFMVIDFWKYDEETEFAKVFLKAV